MLTPSHQSALSFPKKKNIHFNYYIFNKINMEGSDSSGKIGSQEASSYICTPSASSSASLKRPRSDFSPQNSSDDEKQEKKKRKQVSASPRASISDPASAVLQQYTAEQIASLEDDLDFGSLKEVPRIGFKCPADGCGQEYTRITNLKLHLLSKHADVKPRSMSVINS